MFPILRRIPHLFAIHDISEVGPDFMPEFKYHRGPCRADDGRWWAGHPEVVRLIE
ncbi:MAG: hypothetical protein ACE5JU_15510 [Candidatus Binatia bacterium]